MLENRCCLSQRRSNRKNGGIICIFHQMLLGWINEGVTNRRGGDKDFNKKT
jgi:hypothetical protein